MKVYLVGVHDCEGCSTDFVCSTYEIALEKFHELRNKLLEQCREMIKANKEETDLKLKFSSDMYEKMIGNLLEESPDVINNWPHDTPYITEKELI